MYVDNTTVTNWPYFHTLIINGQSYTKLWPRLVVCCQQHFPHGHFYHFTVVWFKSGHEKQNKTQFKNVILSKTKTSTRSNIQWLLYTNPTVINLISATSLYPWEDKQGHKYSLNKQVGVMSKIKECAADPSGGEMHIVAFCLWGFKNGAASHTTKASLQENLIMTRNDKFTLCNYLLPF